MDEDDKHTDVDYREPGTAFICKAKGYRILVCECWGWDCHDCHPHHSDLFNVELSSAKNSQNNTRQKGTGIGTTPLVQNSGISIGGLPLD